MLQQQTRHRLFLITLAFVAFVSLGLPDGLLGVAWPSVRRDFSVPLSQLGSLLLASMCGYLTSSFFSGVAIMRMGVGWLLVASSACMVVALGGYALAPAWPVMVALAVLNGAGGGAIDGGINVFAASKFSPRVMNWMHGFYGVGATLGPVLMTAVLARGASWRWGYAIVASVIAVMGVCFLVTLRWWDDPDGGTAAKPQAAEGAIVEHTTWSTLRQPMVWMQISLFFVYTGIEFATGQWAYTLLTESRGMSMSTAGAAVSTFFATFTVGRFAFGAVANHFPSATLLRAATGAIPVAVLSVWANLYPAVNVAALALLGLSLAPVFPMLMSETPKRLGEQTARRAIGFQVSAASLGGAGLPALIGIVARRAGLEVIAPMLLVNATLLLVFHEIALWNDRRACAKPQAAAEAALNPEP